MKGQKNQYTCQKCRRRTITVDRDEGITPFMIGCTKESCGATAKSSFYRIDQTLKPTHEWYTPKPDEYRKLDPMTREHVIKGGLLLREIMEKQS